MSPNATSAARERYFRKGDSQIADVRPFVAASWRRSLEHKVDAEHLDPPFVEDPNLDVPLVRAATPILERLHEQLADDPVSTMLTDREGVILARTVSQEALTSSLNQVQLAPGHVYSERYVGTNGIGTALASGTAALIRGAEHYAEALHAFDCAAVPIHHPTRGILLGAFNLTTKAEASASMLMALATSTAKQIEAEIAAIGSRRERALFHDYMAACSSARPGAILALNRDVVMMNEQLSALMVGADQPALLEHAREVAEDNFEGRRHVALPSGRVADLRVTRSRREDSDAGAILRVRISGRPQPRPVSARRGSLGLVGTSPGWLRAAAEVEEALVAKAWFCVLGEAGVGKGTLVEAIHRKYYAGRGLTVIEPPPMDVGARMDAWLEEIRAHLAQGTSVLLRDAHLLGRRARGHLERLLASIDRRSCGQFMMTCQSPPSDHGEGLSQLFDSMVEVPPVRHRHQDVEQLVRFFLRRYRPSGEIAFSPEALAMLQQCPWPENVRQIESVVRGLARRPATRTIKVEHLPPECRVSSRSVLTAMESLERDAIIRALLDRDANVQRTSQDLGISRATMYRKMRRYGIVPSNLF